MKRVAPYGLLAIALAVVSLTLPVNGQQGEGAAGKKAPAGKAGKADDKADKDGAKTKVTDKDPNSVEAKASYAIGFSIGRQIGGDGLDVDFDQLVQGLKDAYSKQPSKFTEDELREAMAELQRNVVARRQEKMKAVADKNRKEGKAFLTANKGKKGIKTLESGLQYEVLKSGAGPSPKASDTVKTHYHGTLIDGTVFDSSVERNEPATFPVSGVIRGWTEALQLMKVGDKWKLYVPPELAYGAQGAGNDIGPDAVLVFEVELLGIEK